MWTPEEKFEKFVFLYMGIACVADDIAETEEDTKVVVSGYYAAVTVRYEVGADKTEYICFKSDGIEILFITTLVKKISRKDFTMKYSIRVNEVKKEDSNVRDFATVVFGDSFKITNIAQL